MLNTKIEWADNTHNFWTGCQKVSPGCMFCYAEADRDLRWKHGEWGPNGVRHRTLDWSQPYKWEEQAVAANTRPRVFSNSLGDFFEDRPELEPWRRDAWQIIKHTPHLWWMLLTKRPENIIGMLPQGKAPANVWLGTSIENEDWKHRIDVLRTIPATVRFLSLEPLLGPLPTLNLDGIDWVIVGGESGRQFRPMDPDWARDIRDQCVAQGVPFFFKQYAAFAPKKHPLGRTLDGQEWSEFPTPKPMGRGVA